MPPFACVDGSRTRPLQHVRVVLLESIPAGRFGQPEEVANVALFPASDLASDANGERILVGGAIALRVDRLVNAAVGVVPVGHDRSDALDTYSSVDTPASANVAIAA